jgi:hypothetical protein
MVNKKIKNYKKTMMICCKGAKLNYKEDVKEPFKDVVRKLDYS